jgi:hypothetical protein
MIAFIVLMLAAEDECLGIDFNSDLQKERLVKWHRIKIPGQGEENRLGEVLLYISYILPKLFY